MQIYWFVGLAALLCTVEALPRNKRSPQFFYPGGFGHIGGWGPHGGGGWGPHGGGGWGPHGGGAWGGPGFPGMRFHPRPFGSAYCRLVQANNSQVMGEIYLDQPMSLGPVQIYGEINGLSPGRHGFHIHEVGDTAEDCAAAGPHFNPSEMMHGAPDSKNRHAGDLGNIEAGASGGVVIELADSEISLVEGNPRNVMMRSIVVHAMEDDLGTKDDEESKKTGNAGARLACCVIEKPKFYY